MGNITELDPFDPRNWNLSTHEYRIYGDSNATIYSVVDEDDYLYFNKWRWLPKQSRCRVNKFYLRRAKTTWKNGIKGKTLNLYLHIEIMKRTGIVPPSKAHCLIDHRDGNSLNCRKSNLRWATHAMNVKNKHGLYGHDLIEG